MALHLRLKTQPVVETPVQSVAVSPAVTKGVTLETAAVNLTSEFVALSKKLESIDGKNLLKRMEEIRKELVTIANENFESNVPVTFDSDLGSITFSPRGKESVVPDVGTLLDHLYDKFGRDVMLSVVNIGITDLKKVLSEMELNSFVEKVDGARSIKGVTFK